jgi:prevent-host-death family protein
MNRRPTVIISEDRREKTMTVGVRELKARLSYYLRRVKSGDCLGVTERGETVALLLPSGPDPDMEHLSALIREGAARWSGGKPAGSDRPIKTKGRAVSDLVIEDRR